MEVGRGLVGIWWGGKVIWDARRRVSGWNVGSFRFLRLIIRKESK